MTLIINYKNSHHLSLTTFEPDTIKQRQFLAFHKTLIHFLEAVQNVR